MNPSQAVKVESEVAKLCEKHPGVWMTVSKELRPELKMIRIEISIKVDDDSKHGTG